MLTVARLGRLADHYDVEEPKCGKLHKFFDDVDDAAGITTKWGDNHCCQASEFDTWTCPGDHRNRRYVGARLALHEQHLENKGNYRRWDAMDEHPEKHFFWLGREAA